MTRISLIALGAFAIMASAICLLVLIPQAMLRTVRPAAQLAPYTAVQERGRAIYIREGCLYCHSQQVRDPAYTTDVERGWGTRPTVPADYVYDRPHLLGTMRTGPDLINVGQRLPDLDWHLIHLYDPRALVDWSIMPAYPYLFALRAPGDVRTGERLITIPGPRAPQGRVVVATADAIALAEYLISLKRQYPVPADAHATEQMVGGGTHGGAGDGR
jgi:cytochrome c oxidase cbb3-type subunit II